MSDIWGNIGESTGLLPHEQAEWADATHLAKFILDTIGYDHSSDDCLLWEAEWDSDEYGVRIALTKEADTEGKMKYWLDVDDAPAGIKWNYSVDEAVDFDDITLNLIVEGAEDDAKAELSAIFVPEQPEFAGHREMLVKLLRSAPMDVSRAPHDPFWEAMFQEIVQEMTIVETREADKSGN